VQDIKGIPTGVSRLSKLVELYPPAFEGNRLNLLFLEDAWPITNPKEYLIRLDSQELAREQREYYLGDPCEWPFPTISIEDKPDPWAISTALFNWPERARQVLTVQSQIGQILVQRARAISADVVALMIVDGFSYFDLPQSIQAEPCLVDGVTTTQYGYRQVIGKPSVAQRLFCAGYRDQIGLTYFDKDTNSLARELYATFGHSQVHRVKSFEEGLTVLRTCTVNPSFVQITAPGLDHLCHNHPDAPPLNEYIRIILSRFDALICCLKSKGKRVLGCLTADHGILWRKEFEQKAVVLDTLTVEDTWHPRYVLGSYLRTFSRVVKHEGCSYSLLQLPYLTRPLKRTEWGVHGGVSAWESIVPLITTEVIC
jgi:hypothetical protein